MATESETQSGGRGIARKLMLPAAISLVGTVVGFILTKRQSIQEAAPKLREAVSDLPRPHVPQGGVGDLAGELRDKVDSVLGKDAPASGSVGSAASADESTTVDRSALEKRRRAREQRRNQRRRSRS